MPEPIVFISHFAIKEGKLDALMETARPRAEALEAGKPRTLVFLAYLDAKRRTVSFLHAFASAEDMDQHFEGAQERAASAYEFIEPRGWEIYGSPVITRSARWSVQHPRPASR
jgi:hypothetical protein